MQTVDVMQAAKILSKLVAALECGTAAEIVLTRNGTPVARLVPLSSSSVTIRRQVVLGG